MKSIIAILIAFVFLFQSTSKLLVVANYEINKEYISKNLCENKAKPKSKCNGKCHLRKQLKKEEKKENQTPASQKEKSEIQFFSDKKLFAIPFNTIKEAKFNNFSYLFSKSNKHLSGVFHPPQV